jgi:hypothetical protein
MVAKKMWGSHPDFSVKEELIALSRFDRLVKGFARAYPDDVNSGSADWTRKSEL